MKKLYYCLAILFMCMFTIPVFSACSNEVGTNLQKVKFTQDVFEADLEVPFALTYKIYPSTAIDMHLQFYFSVSTGYHFENGMFTIANPDIGDITATVSYGDTEDETDTCIIRQKKYPTNLYFDTETSTVNKGGSKNLVLKGLIDGVEQTIDPSMYNIELTSSAPNVVVVNNGSLMAVSTGLSGSAIIEARVRKIGGTILGVKHDNLTGFVATTRLTVIDNIDSAAVVLEGQDKFINATNTYDRTAQNTYTTTKSSLKFNIALYSKDGVFLNDSGVKIDVISVNPTLAQVSATADGTYIKENGFYVINLLDNGIACIEVTSSATDSNGDPVKFIFYISKQNP